MSENNANTNQTAESDSKAVQVKLTNQLANLSDEDKALFQMYSNENQNLKMNIPEIRVNYDEDSGEKGGFVLITYEPDEAGKMVRVKTYLDKEIDIVILRTRFKFGYYDENEGEKGMEVLGTPELDDYNGEVSLWDNKERKVIFTGQYKEFKKFIVSSYPDAELIEKGFKNSSIIKHTEILYVEYNGKVCRMYLAKSSRDQYWEYKEEIKGVPTFVVLTKLTTVKEKKGAIPYYPIHFAKIGETEIKKYLHLRKQLDNDLKLFDEARANIKSAMDGDTIKGGNPEDEIKRKWNLNFPEGFVYPNCPNCGEKMVLKDSFKGPFFGCPKFPECKGISEIEKSISETIPTINLDKQGEVEQATAPEPEDDKENEDEEIDVKNIPF
jgi:predicted RNA-binding Zn-ribbon protein involved in translation (DUF1610 family)